VGIGALLFGLFLLFSKIVLLSFALSFHPGSQLNLVTWSGPIIFFLGFYYVASDTSSLTYQPSF